MQVRSLFVAAILALSMLAVTRTAVAQDTCPPNPKPAAIPVPGKPGETGWLIQDVEADANGNKIQLWCLQSVAGPNPPAHGGPDFALLYKPAGAKDADAVWVGACTFPGGQNKPNKDFTKLPNGKPKQFTKVTWFNYEPPPNGANDWDYSYDPATGNLTLSKTTGAYFAVVDRLGRIVAIVYKSKIVATDTYPAPKNFGDIKFTNGGNTTQVTQLFPGPGGLAAEAVTAVASANGNAWSYALNVNTMGGSGTQADPFIGTLADVKAGDTFSIAAFNILAPSVSGAASDPANGGWVVDSFNSNFVTFRATADAEFLPGTQITGFGFSSSAPLGTIAWGLQSSNEAIGSQGVVRGPALPPSQLFVAGPSTSVAVGDNTSITATVQAASNDLPGIPVTFTSTTGNVTFNNGTVSPDGAATTIVTATNGQAVASMTVTKAGTFAVQVSVPGTGLSASVTVNGPTPAPTPTATPAGTLSKKRVQETRATRRIR
ncbi:MAG TPA: hypothetical protein VNW97_16145 [Candidatus Saccharimonadales bacterium]|jgi:hypothetical protein|nr:hypothetical protein [Candidatus Saccharimonadales bacterium]